MMQRLRNHWAKESSSGFLAPLFCFVCMHAKLLQLCPTLCNSMDYSPPGSSVHGNFPGKNTGVCCHSLLQGIFRPRERRRNLTLQKEMRSVRKILWVFQALVLEIFKTPLETFYYIILFIESPRKFTLIKSGRAIRVYLGMGWRRMKTGEKLPRGWWSSWDRWVYSFP